MCVAGAVLRDFMNSMYALYFLRIVCINEWSALKMNCWYAYYYPFEIGTLFASNLKF